MKIFHGWRIVGAGALTQFLHSALLNNGFGAYVAALSDERGWSKTSLSGGAALQSLEGALLGPAMGWLMDRFGGRAMVRTGLVFFGVGLIVFSRVESLAAFYGAFVLMAIGTSLSGYFPWSVIVMHWFRRRRARALSTSGLGLALGGVAVPLLAAAMQAWGWRTTALASGILVLLVAWPLSSLIHTRPADIGETVDGEPEPPTRSPADEQAAASERPAVQAAPAFSASQALRTPAFWLLGIGHGLALLVVTSVNVHAISHLKENLGYTIAQASLVVTAMTVFQVVGLLLGATVGDRWDKRNIAAACMLGHMMGLLLLTYSTHAGWLLGFAVLHGVSWGLRGPLMQALRADYFGLQAIGMIMGLSALITAVGQVSGPLLAGALRDYTGDYRVGFTMLALLAGSGSVIFFCARRPVPPKAP